MVRNYVRKTERQKWDEMGFLKAANQYDVPKSSLERYVKNVGTILTIKLITQMDL